MKKVISSMVVIIMATGFFSTELVAQEKSNKTQKISEQEVMAAQKQFRVSKRGALSYFVGHYNKYPEDHGSHFSYSPK